MIVAPGGAEARLQSFLRRMFSCEDYGFVSLGNGRIALYLAMEACSVGRGARVAVNAMCCDSVLLPLAAAGAEPVYVDNEPGNFCMSAEALDAALTRGNIQAVISAHLVGQRSDMPRLAEICKRHGVPLIEDAAYLAGLRVGDELAGQAGQVGLWSFNSKLLSARGELFFSARRS
jgi:dTDP-4-amino-4,6-dideoxygalactose transaminase